MGFHASVRLRLNDQDLAAIEHLLADHPYELLAHKPDHQAVHTILSTIVNLAHADLTHQGIETPHESPPG